MLNYIWAGLIIISIVFAAGHDINDQITNTYGNGIPVKVSYSSNNFQNEITAYFRENQFTARLHNNELIIPIDTASSPFLQKIASFQASNRKTEIRCKIISHNEQQQYYEVLFPEIHWVKLKSITQAAFDMAESAVKLAIGLAGIMALWLGLMQIAEKSGLIFIFVKGIHPLLRWLFPEIPKDHPALGGISLNLAANVLGLGNAATPLGINAMQQLQSLNDKKEQASNSMCMFLALNTSSVQLLPPVTLIALMGTQVSELIVPIILATSCSTIAAIIVAKSFARATR